MDIRILYMVLIVVFFIVGIAIGSIAMKRTEAITHTYTVRELETKTTTVVSREKVFTTLIYSITRTSMVTKTMAIPTTVTLTKFITTTSIAKTTITKTLTTTERVVVIPQGKQQVIAWMLSTCDRDHWKILEKYAYAIDIVSPDWYYLNEMLGISKYEKRCAEDREFLEFMKKLGIKVMPMVVTANSEWVRKLVTDPSAIESFAIELINLAKKYGYIGFNIDFEVSIPENAADFANFIDIVAKRLHRYGLIVTVDVPAKRMEWPSRYTATYDYGLLGKTDVDAIMIMAYDFYEWSGRPKPVAPLWWVEDCIKYALQYIPKEKLILGIPNYGKVWYRGGSFKNWLLYPDWLKLLKESGKNYTVDKDLMEKVLELDNEVAYFVDGEMGYYRALLAVKYDLKGIAVWRLDKGDPDAWKYYADALGKKG
ncbi:MAG TPA: hypothetical protein ENF93_01775 [Ignisphaera sp.]|nr:hypothetical protein [Ignisphaera sp.]